MAGEKKIEKSLINKIENISAKVEKLNTLEKGSEKNIKPLEEAVEDLAPSEKLKPANLNTPSTVANFQQQRAAAIDDILAAGLNEVFVNLKADQQQAFKKKGEETVKQINNLLSKTKVKINKIISLIRAWLKLIPGVNKFFLEQEAKIKADKILKIKDKF